MKEINEVEKLMELLGSLPVQGSELHPADVNRIRESAMPFLNIV